jgi:hypothetical protein
VRLGSDEHDSSAGGGEHEAAAMMGKRRQMIVGRTDLFTLPNGWPLSCGRARCYHAAYRARPPALLRPAAVSFSGLLDGE